MTEGRSGLPLPEEACVEAYQALLERFKSKTEFVVKLRGSSSPPAAPTGAKIGVVRDTYPNALMKAWSCAC